MILELERAQGVADAFDCIRKRVGKVVHGVDAPVFARARVGGFHDAVNHRVAHVDVAGRHVDLGPQHLGAVRKFAVLHTGEEIEILFDAAPAIGAVLAGLSQRAAIGADFLGVQIVELVTHGGAADSGDLSVDDIAGLFGKVEGFKGDEPAVRKADTEETTVTDSYDF